METLGQHYVQCLSFLESALHFRNESIQLLPMGVSPGKLSNRNNMLGILRWVNNGCSGKNSVPRVAKNLGEKRWQVLVGVGCSSDTHF